MSSQVVIDSMGNEFKQCFALSRNENGNNLNQAASSDTPLYLKVSQICNMYWDPQSSKLDRSLNHLNDDQFDFK